jgi:hypothetical protein
VGRKLGTPLILIEKQIPRANGENGAKNILGPTADIIVRGHKILHNCQPHNLKSSPHTLGNIKSRGLDRQEVKQAWERRKMLDEYGCETTRIDISRNIWSHAEDNVNSI